MNQYRRRVTIKARHLKSWILARPLVAFLLFLLFLSILCAPLVLRGSAVDLRGLLTGILSGIVASLATYALVQYFFLERHKSGPTEWLQLGTQNVWVVPTYLEHPSPRYPQMNYYVVPPFDAQAATFLKQLLQLADIHYPRRQFAGSHRFVEDILKDNLALLCLPERNQYTRVFLGLYHEIYVMNHDRQKAIQHDNILAYVNDTACQREYFGLKWRPLDVGNPPVRAWEMRHFGVEEPQLIQAWRQSSINLNPTRNMHVPGTVNYDYSLIVKGPNPINPAATILLVFGIHGIGTLGGSLYLYQNAEDLFHLYPARGQSHLIEVRYTTKAGCDNYIDAEILQINHVHYEPLPDRP